MRSIGEVEFPTRDMVADLVAEAIPELGLPEVRPMPRHIRLYVGGWMLGDPADAFELYRAVEPELLNKPELLTTESVAAEVLRLLRAYHALAENRRVGS